MKKTFGLLGQKLGHSYSPMIHGYLGDYEYPLYEVCPDDLDGFMKSGRFDGLNVTIPYKQAVIPYCNSLTDEARAIGSVNTIVRDANGLLHGFNTDRHGFAVMLERAKIDPRGKKTLVLGDGGSARAVRAALGGLDAGEVVTISRRGENHYGNIDRHHDAEIIINTTPVGMYPGNGLSPLDLEGFVRLEGAADLIYNPLRTKLLLGAEKMGLPCTGGLTMLVAQAEMASRLFLGLPARPELVDGILSGLIGKIRNIALIGMPGSGKSSAGRRLAEIMGRPFSDTDELVEAAAGKTIPEIIEKDGEEAFRLLETRQLDAETKKHGLVIATGGGVVTRPENLDLLRQNSLIVYLKRELSGLDTTGRPLSQSIGIRALAEQRLHLYEAWSDRSVQADPDPGRTASRILEEVL